MEELDNYKNWLHKKSALDAVKYNELAQRELCAKEVYNVLRIVIVKRRKGKDCYVHRLLILGSIKYVAMFLIQNHYYVIFPCMPTNQQNDI